jgi:hypothetical protein
MQHLTPTERRQVAEAKAATQRAQALVLRHRHGATYAEIGAALSVSLERARRITCKAERFAFDPRWSDTLPVRAIYLLGNSGLIELSELEAAHALAQLSARELLSTPNFGHDALGALRTWLAGHGLKLRPESPTAWGRRLRARKANEVNCQRGGKFSLRAARRLISKPSGKSNKPERETLEAHWNRVSNDARTAFLNAIGVAAVLENMSADFGRDLRRRVPAAPKSKQTNDPKNRKRPSCRPLILRMDDLACRCARGHHRTPPSSHSRAYPSRRSDSPAGRFRWPLPRRS